MKKKSILHISICCQDCSPVVKKALQNELVSYSKKIAEDHCNPIVDIRIDALDTQEEKQVLLELSYHYVLTKTLSVPLKTIDDFYTPIAIFTGAAIQRLYEKNPNTGTENWLLISLTSLKSSDGIYNIQWSSGYHCCQANYHSATFPLC